MVTDDNDAEQFVPARPKNVCEAFHDMFIDACMAGLSYQTIGESFSVSRVLARYSFSIPSMVVYLSTIFAISSVIDSQDKKRYVDLSTLSYTALIVDVLIRNPVSMDDTHTRVRPDVNVYGWSRYKMSWVIEHHTPFLSWLGALFTHLSFILRWATDENYVTRAALYIVAVYGISSLSYFFYEAPDPSHLRYCAHFYENVYRFADYHKARIQLSFLGTISLFGGRVFFGDEFDEDETSRVVALTLVCAGLAFSFLSLIQYFFVDCDTCLRLSNVDVGHTV